MDTFWKKVEKSLYKKAGPAILSSISEECILWTGGQFAGGYGRVAVKWPGENKIYNISAHRLSFMFLNKTINLDPNLEVSHLCHRTLCVNPRHLVLEPHLINLERKMCKVSQVCLDTHKPPCLF